MWAFILKVLTFVIENWQFFSGLLGMLLVWFGVSDKYSKTLKQAEKKYEQAKQIAKSKDIYKTAQTAYGVVSKYARQTENTIDDKAAKGLEIALNLMEKLGWDKADLGNGERDVIEKIFDQLHEAEHLALQAAYQAPVSNVASKAGEIAAPLA